VELDLEQTSTPFMTVFGQNGPEEVGLNLKDLMQQMPGFKERTRRRKLKVVEALPLLVDQEAKRLVDPDRVNREAVSRTEQAGIVFLDEIDKIASRSGNHGGAEVSREGVQRDLLPVVEGSTVSTKYGPVKTDHILFIAAGAFHVAKVSDLIPELQGRFPIRVELESLGGQDFRRILVEPKNALTKQYAALMATEGIELTFDDGAVDAIAAYAEEANRRAENIGARRLHTIMEALLEELGFSAPEREAGEKVLIDAEAVRRTLAPIMANDDLSRYVL
jgi:ATP-dependent HslUV protease ATP-binding subunit HslU